MTAADLAGRVLARIREGDSPTSAIQAVHAELEHSDLAELFSEHGRTWVRTVVAPYIRKPRSVKAEVSTSPSRRTPAVSWRGRNQAGDPLSMELPIPGTDDVKSVRDLTAHDVGQIERAYTAISRVADARAEKWGRIRRRMHADETLGQAIEAGRMRRSELEWIGHADPAQLAPMQEAS